MTTMARNVLLLVTLLQTVVWVKANYHIGYSINDYSNPSNALSDGTCCNGNCTTDNCRTTLRLCFRDANHPHDDTESDCAFIVNRENPRFFAAIATREEAIEQYYSQSFQIYVRVSHSLQEDRTQADFEPPFTDPLIDDIFIEANVVPASFTGDLLTQTYNVTGDFGQATLEIAVHVRCAQNYNGSGCEMLCDADGTNCLQVLTPPTEEPSDEETTTEEPSDEETTTNTPNTPSTAPVIDPTSLNIVPIAVGVAVGAVVLIILGVIAVIIIVYFVKKIGKQGSWDPKRTPHYTLEKTEKNLSNDMNRISYISTGAGDAAAHTTFNEQKSSKTSPPKPPPYQPQREDDSPTTEIAPAKDFVMGNQDAEDRFAGYELVTFDHPSSDEEAAPETPKQPEGLTYASLDIHRGNGHVNNNDREQTPAEDDDEEEEEGPIKYAEVRHTDD